MLRTALLGWSTACPHVYPVALEILQLFTAFFFPANCPKSTGESISNLSYRTFAIACPRRVGNENLISAYRGGSAFKPPWLRQISLLWETQSDPQKGLTSWLVPWCPLSSCQLLVAQEGSLHEPCRRGALGLTTGQSNPVTAG